MTAPPADARAAFAEYAADGLWVASHLGQLLGTALIGAALLALSWRLRGGRAGVWAALGAAGAVATVTLAGALQAVDGIALKVMVDRWAEAPADVQALYFEGAFAVRQVEVGLAAMGLLFFGATAACYAAASWRGEDVPGWLGWAAAASAIGLLVAGLLYAYTGFSDPAMTAVTVATLLMAVWIVGAGVFLLRRERPRARDVEPAGGPP